MTRRNTSQRDRFRATAKRTQAACALCGNPIDYTLGWTTDPDTGRRRPNLRMFVADHIVPLDSAKTDAERRALDVPANMQAAHWDCNSKKRARTHAPIIRRSSTLA